MVVDIIFCLALVGFVALGAFRGALRTLLSFVTVFLSIVGSILLAWPLALLFNRWFGWADRYGLVIVILIIAIVLFILIRIGVFLLERFIIRLKLRSRALNRVDTMFGLLIGFARFLLYFFILTWILNLAGNIRPLASIPEWLFDGSTVANWFYTWMSRLINGIGGS